MLDVVPLNTVQLPGHAAVRVDRARDALLTDFGKATLDDRYLLPGESYQDLFARVASAYADDAAHAQRLYDYISKLWFMPATPVLSNGGTTRGLPISCFLNEAEDSLEGIVALWNENVWLAAKGGGIGSYWGNLRSIGEKVGAVGKTSGVIPFIRVMDSLTLAISQGSLRRGSAAVYLPVHHPEIEEFVEIRRPTGGDPNRKALNLHHGVLIPDAFMRAVEADGEWALVSPKDGSVIRRISARALWIRILTARIETGEPYIVFIDHVNRARPEHHKLAGLTVKTSNLCSEITLPTGRDHHGRERTAVCCLSSLNLETWDEWHDHPTFIEDVMRFLDNVLEDFIRRAPDSMARAKYAAMRERSVGLGVMGFHSFLQAK
ncbi:MAG: ribonucleoside-diphosphate reductase subunit alpha, partial [Elioraea sp.]|nr:ribonucleoside-diphosphate reductase subunit alpha [Elioraea sp.]